MKNPLYPLAISALVMGVAFGAPGDINVKNTTKYDLDVQVACYYIDTSKPLGVQLTVPGETTVIFNADQMKNDGHCSEGNNTLHMIVKKDNWKDCKTFGSPPYNPKYSYNYEISKWDGSFGWEPYCKMTSQ